LFFKEKNLIDIILLYERLKSREKLNKI